MGGRQPGTHIKDGRAPHRQPSIHLEGGEPDATPLLLELQRQLEEDGGCEATDGCVVEPDGTGDHGQPSWLLTLGFI